MRKGKHERQKYRIIEVYSVLILIATIFMGIGHATISGIAMSIEGDTKAKAQEGVFITDITYMENQEADTTNSKINYFLQTMLESEVVLGNTTSSTITYKVTVYNKTDKEQLFIGVVTDKEDLNLYSNSNIEYSLETIYGLAGIEQYVTTIAPNSSKTFPLTFKYKSGADINQNTLKSKLNFRFMENPVLNLSNENQTYKIENIYEGYESEEYEFTVTNFTETKTNTVPMEYYIEKTIDSPLTVKIYNENGIEVTEKINVDIQEQETHKYTAKIIWDSDNRGAKYEGKEYKCKITVKAKPTDAKYLECTIAKEFNINITTCAHNYVDGVCTICGKEIIWDGQSMEVTEIKDFNWEIYNGDQYYFLANFVNNGLTEEMKEMLIKEGYDITSIDINSDTTISLMENLYLANHEWTPIGKDAENSFDGVFEGNDHFIAGANISSSTDSVGVLGHVTGEVNNLIIKDSLIEATGTNNAGGIVGYLADTGEINNCHNVNTEVKGNAVVGGVAGEAYGDIYKSTSSGTVTGNATQTGGIAGIAYKNIEECENSGSVTALGNAVGGITGRVGNEGKILSCKNTGDVTVSSTGTTDAFVGGISGIVVGHIEKSSNYGTVSSQTSARWNRVGGIAAALGTSALNASIKECSNFGDVSAIGTLTYLALAGGIVGDTTNTIIINDCYNSGNIIGTQVQYSYVGGILGRVQGIINMENCYSKGEINKDAVASRIITKGGIIGKMAGSYDGINNIYYYDALDNNIGAISGKDSVTYNAMETENIFNNFEEFSLWLTANNSNNE